MERKLVLQFIVSIILQACGQNVSQSKHAAIAIEQSIEVQKINPEGSTIVTRFSAPEGFLRKSVDSTSFSNYLRTLPLKSFGAQVLFYNGQTKRNNQVDDAVVDLPIGKRYLHQCADAVMRLRAEYLCQNKQYDSIHFNFTN